MIILGVILFLLTTYFYIQTRKLDKIKEIEMAISKDKPKRESLRNQMSNIDITNVNGNKRAMGVATGVAVVLGGIALTVLHIPFVFGMVLGGVVPWMIVYITRQNYEAKYQKDKVIALEFANSIFSAGGTTEEWVTECPSRLEGPLRKEFLKGSQMIRNNTPVINFLENLRRKTHDGYFAYILAGIISNTRDSGDMVVYINEVMNDILQQERFDRVMQMVRKNSNNMLLAMMGFPVALYGMFHNVVNDMLSKSFTNNIILLLWLCGFVGIIILANRVASGGKQMQ